GPAIGRRHAAGTAGSDCEFDSADGHRAAEEWSDIHAELRWAAAVLAGPGNAADVRNELVGAGDSGYAQFLLCGCRGRVVHRIAADRTMACRNVGAHGDLHDSAVVTAPLCDLRANLRNNTA